MFVKKGDVLESESDSFPRDRCVCAAIIDCVIPGNSRFRTFVSGKEEDAVRTGRLLLLLLLLPLLLLLLLPLLLLLWQQGERRRVQELQEVSQRL